MKALILVGGFGTRLRPLTFSKPKPLVPFCNKPMIMHQIEALKKVGVDEVILAVGYNPDSMVKEMDEYAKEIGIKISYSHEKTPMGTAGPLALARDALTADGNEIFFVFNSDISCTYPLQSLLDFHKKHGKEGTIMVTPVEDPSKYGVVLYDDESGKISQFVEKPKNYVGNRINAGLYIFTKKILERIPNRPTSIEREIFPAMAKDGELYALDLPDFWMDVGQPKDYLTGKCLNLNHLEKNNSPDLAKTPTDGSYTIIGPVLIGKNVKIGNGSVIGPNVVIGDNCVIEEGVRLKRTTLFTNVKIGKSSFIQSSIIGWNSSVGKWARVDNNTVLGENVHIKDEIYINGALILPHKDIKENVLKEGTILM
jgi:mannose-1-phosphate guanylyltransferase